MIKNASVEHPGNGTKGDINLLAKPKKGSGWQSVDETIVGAARMARMDAMIMTTMAAIESGFDPHAKNPRSTATGLYQFIDTTWMETLAKHGAKYGISPDAHRFDARANALMGAEFMLDNMKTMRSVVSGRDMVVTDIYLAHFMGPTGARRFLAADQHATGVSVFPKQARSNPEIFFDKWRSRTLREIYDVFSILVINKAARFGVTPDMVAAVVTPGIRATGGNDVFPRSV